MCGVGGGGREAKDTSEKRAFGVWRPGWVDVCLLISNFYYTTSTAP